MSQSQGLRTTSRLRKKIGRPILAGFIGTLLLLVGIVPFPSLHGQGTGQTQPPPQTTAQAPGQNPGQPATPQAATPQVQTPPPPVQLSILLLMDVSGSMADNNKIDQAKEAAIKAVSAP